MGFKLDFVLPPQYESFVYLTTHLGDVGNIKAVCAVWNIVNGWKNNSLRVKSIDEGIGEIILTGRCTDVEQAVSICSYLVSGMVHVRYEKTITTITVEI